MSVLQIQLACNHGYKKISANNSILKIPSSSLACRILNNTEIVFITVAVTVFFRSEIPVHFKLSSQVKSMEFHGRRLFTASMPVS